jgi:hypothetical protein
MGRVGSAYYAAHHVSVRACSYRRTGCDAHTPCGTSRFAYNQCLRLVTDALAAKRVDRQVRVPCSGFDLINAFNTWKRSEAGGRRFVVASDGTVSKEITGLPWRSEVSAQVFEEAAMDLGRALCAYAQAAHDGNKGRRVGFSGQKRKGHCRDSFRIRNRQALGRPSLIRVGESHPRSVTLPTIGTVRVHDDTRRLRRLLRPVKQSDPDTGESVVAPRAKVLFATVSRHGSRWYVSLNVQAPDFHAERRHTSHPAGDHGGFIGVDRGLEPFVVAATAVGPRWAVGKHQNRCGGAWSVCGGFRERPRAPSRARATAPRRPGGCPGITPGSPMYVEASSTRSPVSSSRPTTGCVLRTSRQPT